jgi:hypothetical protein
MHTFTPPMPPLRPQRVPPGSKALPALFRTFRTHVCMIHDTSRIMSQRVQYDKEELLFLYRPDYPRPGTMKTVDECVAISATGLPPVALAPKAALAQVPPFTISYRTYCTSYTNWQGRGGSAEAAVGGWGRGRGKRDPALEPESFRSFGRLPPPSAGSGNSHIDRRRLEQKFGVCIQANVDVYSEDWSVSLCFARHSTSFTILFQYFNAAGTLTGPVSAAKLLEYMSAGLLLPSSAIRFRVKDAAPEAPADAATIESALLRKDDGTGDSVGERTWRRGENPPVGERRALPSSSTAGTLPPSERRTLPPPGSSPKSGPRAEASSTPRCDNEVLELGVIPSLTGQDSDSGIDRRPLYLRAQHASVSPESFQVQIIFC